MLSKRWYARRSKKASLRPVWLRRPRQTRSRASRSQHAAVARHAARRAQRRGGHLEDRESRAGHVGREALAAGEARKVEVTGVAIFLPMACQTPMPVEPHGTSHRGAERAAHAAPLPEQRALGVAPRAAPEGRAGRAATKLAEKAPSAQLWPRDGVLDKLVRLEQPAPAPSGRATSTSASIHIRRGASQQQSPRDEGERPLCTVLDQNSSGSPSFRRAPDAVVADDVHREIRAARASRRASLRLSSM